MARSSWRQARNIRRLTNLSVVEMAAHAMPERHLQVGWLAEHDEAGPKSFVLDQGAYGHAFVGFLLHDRCQDLLARRIWPPSVPRDAGTQAR